MSGPRQAAVAGGSQGDGTGGRSRLLGWEAGAGPRAGWSLVQRIAHCAELGTLGWCRHL